MNTLILGVGNLLLSDEAVGVRIVEALGREYRFAPGIELLDGGTAGMELLEAMASRDHIILADAVRSGNPPGTVVTLKDEEIPTLFGRKISPSAGAGGCALGAAHDGESPKRLTLIGIEPESLEPRIGLTPVVAAAMGRRRIGS